MKRLALFSILYLALISCMKTNDNSFMNPAGSINTLDSSKTYLALGDSYTVGQSVTAEERFPVQTVELLRLQNIKIKDPDIIAMTGWTTTNLLNALNLNPPQKNYSIVSLLIGVNNQYQHKRVDEYQAEFTELLNRAVSYANGNKDHVFVLSIPDYSVTPFAAGMDTAQISKEIDAFNDTNKNISLTAGVHYIDVTNLSREAKDSASFTTTDGLHPSGYQYRQWSTLLARAVLPQLH